MSFPKNDLRDISSSTTDEVYVLGMTQNSTVFNASVLQYATDLQSLYMEKGCLVNVNVMPIVGNNGTIKNATVLIYYNDGETSYDENTTVYMI